MKTIKLLVVIFTIMLSSFELSKSEITSCADTCQFPAQSTIYSYPLACCPNCTVTVNYKTTDCDGYCTIKINSIQMQGYGCPTLTANELINDAVIKILKEWQIRTGCSEQGDTLKTFAVYQAICMKWVGTLGTHEPTDVILVPCESNGCCLSRWMAVKQPDNTWTVSKLWSQIIGICTDPSPDCFITCE